MGWMSEIPLLLFLFLLSWEDGPRSKPDLPCVPVAVVSGEKGVGAKEGSFDMLL